MPSILVVEQEEHYVERISGALSAEGWRVRVVPRADQAIQAAASEAPDLVMVSAEIPGAESLASSFSRSAGGPGVLGLLPELGGAMEADDLLAKPFTDEQLRSAARRALSVRRVAPPVAAAAAADHKLTSQDIFGDVLAEVESDLKRTAGPPPAPAAPPPAAAKPTPAAADDEMQRRLEQTLSGVMKTEPKPRPAAPAPAPPAPPRRAEPQAAANVDALLSKTLGDLDLGRTKTGVRPAPTPPVPAPPPQASAPVAPAPTPPPAAPPPAKESSAPRRRVGDFDFSELEQLARTSRPASPSAPAPPRPAPTPPAASAPVRPVTPAVPSPHPVAPAAPAVQPEPRAATPPPPSPPLPSPPPAPPAAATSLPFDPAVTQRIPMFLEEAGDQPGERFGQYTLLERIAVGGMAEVWKARMRGVEGFQKTVAIKRILPHMTDNAEFVGMFIDEAKLAAQLTHPNIVHIYDLGKIGRDYYIAMEYVEGKDLRSLLNAGRRRRLPLPLELGLLIAARLASALDYAHRKRDFEEREMGLVHRDVSPQNVLLTYEGDVKLCDFGIAKAVSKASQTQIGALKGKLQYMSPEQAWGRPVDARSDLFSLGAVLFEMVTGERQFPGDSEISVLEAVRQGKTRSPRQVTPSVPREVDDIVNRAIAIDPKDRFQSAGEMKHRLEVVLALLAPSLGPTDLAAYIHQVFDPQAAEPPEAAPAPAPPIPAAISWAAEPAAATPALPLAAEPEPPVEAVAPLVEVAAEEEGERKSRTLLYAAIAALVVIAVVTFFILNRRRETAPPPAGASTANPAEALPATNPEAAAAVPPGATATQGGAMPANVKAVVDQQLAAKEEELRRKNEEKLKDLEKQLADAKTTGQPPPAAQIPPVSTNPAPPPAAETPAPAALDPEPQREPEPAKAQPPAASAEPPPSHEPEAPRVKVGDLATPGAGVVPPQLVTFPKPEYPPMARTLRVEGVVVVSVLVDENGQVQEASVAEPMRQKVGLNEAALAAARSARYKPATKEGVRVKMWTRLKIPFKL